MARDESFDNVPIAALEAAGDEALGGPCCGARRLLVGMLMCVSLRTAWLATRALPAGHPYRRYIEGTARTHRQLLHVFGHPLTEKRAVRLAGLALAVALIIVTTLLLAEPLGELRETVVPD